MLPAIIVGSVVSARGVEPFVLDTPTGRVTTGRYAAADPPQGNMSREEKGAAERRVRAEISAVTEVRLGAFRCPRCERWIDVVKAPDDWSRNRCARC
jgi:hypothetical protein